MEENNKEKNIKSKPRATFPTVKTALKKPYGLTPYGFQDKTKYSHASCKARAHYSYPGFCTIRLLLFIACSGMG
ncbi:MAG: hypothetical protein LBC47_01995 [Tannerella sp.]|jgi:hypothetical protein|nr:hypothetical protein [Tannerella sp.]